MANFAINAKPLTNLLKKGALFVWSLKAHEAFEELKRALASTLILVPLLFDQPFILYTSTIDESLGAMLAQEDDSGIERIIYFINHTLVAAELNYSLVEKECLALVHATKKFKHYLHGNNTQVIILFDPLRYLLTQSNLTSRTDKWTVLLSTLR